MKTRNFITLLVLALCLTGVSNLIHPASAQTSQNVVDQLTSEINDVKNTANDAAQSYSHVAQSFQDVKNSIDTLYMISMTGIGVGIAGIVIAVIAITRNKQQN
jgi:phosphotransferase system  glucose/maltose/N-acetylglucosamine-specific IIC component